MRLPRLLPLSRLFCAMLVALAVTLCSPGCATQPQAPSAPVYVGSVTFVRAEDFTRSSGVDGRGDVGATGGAQSVEPDVTAPIPAAAGPLDGLRTALPAVTAPKATPKPDPAPKSSGTAVPAPSPADPAPVPDAK